MNLFANFYRSEHISPGHWTRGSTGITNFRREVRPLYEAAVHWHGDPELFIEERPFNPECAGTEQYFSLHYSDAGQRRNPSLSGFWRLFEILRDVVMERRGQ